MAATLYTVIITIISDVPGVVTCSAKQNARKKKKGETLIVVNYHT